MRVLLAVLLLGIAGCGCEQKVPAKKTLEGHETLTLKGHSGQVLSVSFSPDGKRIVSGGRDGVRVWDISSLDTSE